ncbi:phosphate ABC transporter substrate-binding protein PstS [Nocardiopsis sp. RSe5-2]|uniref:Phosphate-binding protein n=1 Tax=Nocardiopsis endophytica TaxID=3018445 RepID=A0ABT4UFB7_9ACTN|nr:phosphate ABC transporter substrate-binding protein PstS [Nocardiopsis endophytica]MDA2815179.1 phosphate ABC transporter substrate-binding protein PstS [Nocardiopsis endophytica]
MRMRPSTRRACLAAAATGALALSAACGSDNAVRGNNPIPVPDDLACFEGTLDGSGSSAQENAMTTWIAGYQTACQDSLVFYDAIGSGGGRSQFLDSAVAFAGTDAALDPKEQEEAVARCDSSSAVNIPAYVVPIAVVFNLEGVDELNLSPDTIAGIFKGDITKWNAPEIAEYNPDADLPDTAITPVSRSDESGTTENFTEYLHSAAGDVWTYEPGGQWPLPPAEAAQGNSGIAEAVAGGNGTIGYVEASHVGHMSAARVGVGDEFVELSPESAAKVVAEAPRREGAGRYDYALELDYGTTESGVYPIVLVSYQVACLDYEDPDQGERVRDFLAYVISPEGQQAASDETGSAPLPEEIRTDLQATLDAINTGAGESTS